MNSLRISPLAINGEPSIRKADVGFNYGGIVFHCGQHVERLGVNRFLIPISHSGFQSEERFVYEFSCSADHIQFLAIRVHGIDSHNQEIEFEIARLRTIFRLPL
jgi:hypothetical protein